MQSRMTTKDPTALIVINNTENRHPWNPSWTTTVTARDAADGRHNDFDVVESDDDANSTSSL